MQDDLVRIRDNEVDEEIIENNEIHVTTNDASNTNNEIIIEENVNNNNNNENTTIIEMINSADHVEVLTQENNNIITTNNNVSVSYFNHKVNSKKKRDWVKDIIILGKSFISMKQTQVKHPDEYHNCITSELKQMVDQKVFGLIDYDNLTDQQKSTIIPCILFLKEKYDPNGEFAKLKARLLANGAFQFWELYINNTSSTASLKALMTLMTIFAREKRVVTFVDVSGAYLHAKLYKDIYMRLNLKVASLYCELDKKASEYRNINDGSLVVKLQKALYGLKESALL